MRIQRRGIEPRRCEARDSIHRSCRRSLGSAGGHPSGPACPHPPIHPRQLHEGHQNCRHRRQHAIHTALALHRRPLQVRTQLAAVGRGGQAAPLLPPVPRSADINPVFQHRVPKIPPLDANATSVSPYPDLQLEWQIPPRLGRAAGGTGVPRRATFRWPSRFRPAGRKELIAGH